MFEAGHLSGGAAIWRRFPIRATVSDAGQVGISVTDTVGIAEATTTSFADAVGLMLDTATYSTTQADLDDPGSDANVGALGTVSGLDMGKVVTVSIRPDLVIKALMNGGATESTAMVLVSNTSASAGGTVVTDADLTPEMISGTIWCISGGNVGHARMISAMTAGTSATVTVPFPRTIAVGDEFLFCPWGTFGTGAASLDGVGNLQTSTLGTQADATIGSGTGGLVVVTHMECKGRSDSYVYFTLQDHQLGTSTN